jgi:hypothetical protein
MDAGDVKETSESTESSENRDPNYEQNEGAIGGFANPPASSSTGKHNGLVRYMIYKKNFKHISCSLFIST